MSFLKEAMALIIAIKKDRLLAIEAKTFPNTRELATDQFYSSSSNAS
jgi:hypothetical protein